MSYERHSTIGIHGLHAHEAAHGVKRIALMRRAQVLGLLLLLALCAGGAIVIGQRVVHSRELALSTRENARQYVNVVTPRPGKELTQLQLPGSLQGYTETGIYARTNGYVSRWYKDIGDRVNKGDLLAEIATPEVERQLSEARATRMQVQSNVQLARSSFERWQKLRQRDAVSQQELDERQNTLRQGEANLAATDANVQRLEQLVSYNRILAPFAGVVTRRNVDVGNLVDAGNGGSPKQLYALSQVDPLRLFVAVPQSYSPKIRIGMEAQVTLAELTGRRFTGKVVRTAGAIDPVSRTMQVEINIPNKDGSLLPGSYVKVALQTGVASQMLTVPNNTLLFRPEGIHVAAVGADGKVHLQKVVVGRDLGVRIEIQSGLSPGDKLIINPSDALAEGDEVVATDLPETKAPATRQQGKS